MVVVPLRKGLNRKRFFLLMYARTLWDLFSGHPASRARAAAKAVLLLAEAKAKVKADPRVLFPGTDLSSQKGKVKAREVDPPLAQKEKEKGEANSDALGKMVIQFVRDLIDQRTVTKVIIPTRMARVIATLVTTLLWKILKVKPIQLKWRTSTSFALNAKTVMKKGILYLVMEKVLCNAGKFTKDFSKLIQCSKSMPRHTHI